MFNYTIKHFPRLDKYIPKFYIEKSYVIHKDPNCKKIELKNPFSRYRSKRYPKLAEYLEQERKKRNLSPKEFAKKIGIPTRIIYTYLSGNCFPTKDNNLEKLCKYLRIPEKDLEKLVEDKIHFI